MLICCIVGNESRVSELHRVICNGVLRYLPRSGLFWVRDQRNRPTPNSPPVAFSDQMIHQQQGERRDKIEENDGSEIALGLLANLKKARKVKGACLVEATSITTVVKE
jgi:hypothetical protein